MARERASKSAKIYKSVNTMLAAKVNYAKSEDESLIFETTLVNFREQAREFRQLVKQGVKTEEEYITFLNSYKKRTTK